MFVVVRDLREGTQIINYLTFLNSGSICFEEPVLPMESCYDRKGMGDKDVNKSYCAWRASVVVELARGKVIGPLCNSTFNSFERRIF